MKDKPIFFTKHQLKRMTQRGMSKKIIQTVVDNGRWSKGEARYSFEVEYKGVIVILYEQKTQYNLGTCKLNREYTEKAQMLKGELGIGFWQAVHKVVKGIDFNLDKNKT